MELSEKILQILDERDVLESSKLSEEFKLSHQKIVGTIKSLESLGEIINVEQNSIKLWSTTDEGSLLAEKGSHEAGLFSFIGCDGKTIDDVKANFPSASVALGAALKKKWVRKEGDRLIQCVEQIIDQVQKDLQAIKSGASHQIDNKTKVDYKKRKLIKEIDTIVFKVSKGKNFSTEVHKQETELTKEMIESGEWKSKAFKSFNFNAKGKIEHRSGGFHPLMYLRSEFRKIFLEMGFTEMPTNNYIESAFWNFDALFQPQQHPARDAQDTFYISNPERTISVPQDYLERVRKVHTEGDFGSTGYRSPWSYDESMKNLLRTHTTAVSARLLYKLAQDGFKPAKYFSIDKVYRNETLDATHLAEFHQVEGVIADYNLSMKHLMGVFSAFFEKIGIPNIRFKSTYNPYTEPSMEIYSFHDGLKKWVEVGNSGYFRPEMLRPMGLPENVTVAGWGLSLERPAMIMSGKTNIRELVGPRVKIDFIMDNPICSIDKFQRDGKKKGGAVTPFQTLKERQENILRRLQELDARVSRVTHQKSIASHTKEDSSESSQLNGFGNNGLPLDFVIYADPKRPPYSLLPIAASLSRSYFVTLMVHTHSSLLDSESNLLLFWDRIKCSIKSQCPSSPKLHLRLVWRPQLEFTNSLNPSLAISPINSMQICGESNIGRFFCRLINCSSRPKCAPSFYEGSRSQQENGSIDKILDECDDVLSCEELNKSQYNRFLKNIEANMSSTTPFLGCQKDPTLGDIILLSTLRLLDVLGTSPNFSGINRWTISCQQHPLTSLVM